MLQRVGCVEELLHVSVAASRADGAPRHRRVGGCGHRGHRGRAQPCIGMPGGGGGLFLLLQLPLLLLLLLLCFGDGDGAAGGGFVPERSRPDRLAPLLRVVSTTPAAAAQTGGHAAAGAAVARAGEPSPPLTLRHPRPQPPLPQQQRKVPIPIRHTAYCPLLVRASASTGAERAGCGRSLRSQPDRGSEANALVAPTRCV
mmetsp:Transcript_35698/g.89178  ORF Transcript_35698/g.89178 Transcript_35698/m.89178 type:complete len:200 (+) Transcript_35698:1531-2130(+)